MIPLNYHHLFYFWTTIKRGSITKASKDLYLTQPALSQQLQQLERSLKLQLFTRSRGGVVLTGPGRKVFEHCERIFTEGESLSRSLQEDAGGPTILRLGISAAISREIILKIRGSIKRPGVTLLTTVFTGSLGGLHERLSRHLIDLAVSEVDLTPSLGQDFSGRLVDAIPVHFVAAPRLKKTLRGFPPRSAELRMLLRTPENPIRKSVDAYLKRRGVAYAIAAETDDADLIRIMAIEGDGVAALSALVVQKDLAQGRLAAVGSEQTGIKEFVWFAASVRPDHNPVMSGIMRDLMTRFSLRA
jgi:LysR family transcriptional activator of nhaA